MHRVKYNRVPYKTREVILAVQGLPPSVLELPQLFVVRSCNQLLSRIIAALQYINPSFLGTGASIGLRSSSFTSRKNGPADSYVSKLSATKQTSKSFLGNESYTSYKKYPLTTPLTNNALCPPPLNRDFRGAGPRKTPRIFGLGTKKTLNFWSGVPWRVPPKF